MKIGFIADIHEDLSSLKQAFLTLEKNNCNYIVCLGDIIGFAIQFQKFIELRDANACIEIVNENCVATIAGNHDLYAVKRIPEFNAGFSYPNNWYELDYETRAKHSKNQIWLYEDSELPTFLNEKSQEYLLTLPEYKVLFLDGIRFLFSHFCYPDISGSTIKSPKTLKDILPHFELMKKNECLLSFSGHGHPEGIVITSKEKYSFNKFGSFQIEKDNQWIVCPCVANTSRPNGVTIFDTRTYQLDVLPLNSPKTIV